MAFSDLTTGQQDTYMVAFEFFAKALIIFVFIFLAYYYTKQFNPKSKSPYAFSRIFKGYIYLIAKAFLFTSPLLIFLLFPQVGLEQVLMYMVIGYAILLPILSIVVVWNMILYGTGFVMDFLGIDNKYREMNKPIQDIIGNKTGLK